MSPRAPLALLVQRFAGRLRFPVLFLLTAALFIVNLFVPDPIPLLDEILLGLGAVLLGSWKQRKNGDRDDRLETSGPGS